MSSTASMSPPASASSSHQYRRRKGTKRHHGEGHYDEAEEVKRSKTDFSTEPFFSSRYLIAHEVMNCNRHQDHVGGLYQDIPRLVEGDSKATPLHGEFAFTDDIFEEEYAEENPDVGFIVIRSYSCEEYYETVKDKFKPVQIPANVAKALGGSKAQLSILEDNGSEAPIKSEKIHILSKELEDALGIIQLKHPWHIPSQTEFLEAPYLGFYHSRQILRLYGSDGNHNLSDTQQAHVRALIDYMQISYGQDYAQADEMFAQGLVSKHHFPKLFGPDEVVVRLTDNGPMAYMTTSASSPHPLATNLKCWAWEFDGLFYKTYSNWAVNFPHHTDEIFIATLPVYPLKYDLAGLEGRLLERGNQFWAHKTRTFVEYESPDSASEIRTSNNRYMLDMDTYRKMHPDSIEEHEEIGEGYEKLATPPSHTFLLILPTHMRGYGFHDKKWNTLMVERIRPVKWSDDTFDRRLFIKPQKKELIKALVTMHIAPQRPYKSDIIEGKGRGLILLLHGGPGTGKTLTAESVAEFAQKPLYRVTCGDIGTDPESVERYLESVLYIGTLWGCVVLLDEADVFLEERTPTDLQRNALVSVFLRILEYFEGILILTSNRVGTFDEAFKSRVQLHLHYPPLDEKDRWAIWDMFFRDLLQEEERVRYDELKDKRDILARNKLNGRQIRNTINTARQLARYRNEELAYTHFDQALEVLNEFEAYLTDMQGHTDEEYARSQGIRGD